MKFTVVWSPSAGDQLAEIWLDASNRQGVTAAQAAIDVELGEDAHSKGRELAEDLFVFSVAPLQVLFELLEPDRLVRVIGVRQLPDVT